MMRHKIKWIILLLLTAVFIYSGVQLYRSVMEYKVGTDEYDMLAQDVYADTLPPVVPAGFEPDMGGQEDEEETQEQEQQDAALSFDIGHEKLREINKDYIGWIAMNDQINYPVVQGSDNTYYLTHTFYGTQNKAGTIFMAAENEEGWDAKNIIIYGHNIKNNTMFATLMQYEDQAFFEQHRYFSIYTEDGVSVYGIFAAFRTGETSEAYQYGFADDEDFMNYIALMQSWSVIDTGMRVGKDDQIITLSTCTNVNNGRFIVQGKKIE